jgi:hypothetical protein
METLRCCAPAEVDGDALVRSGDVEVADGVQVDAARMGARSAVSISSWSVEEGRPERL